MKQDIDGTDTTVTLADTIDARLEQDRQMRRRSRSIKPIVAITAAVVVGATAMLAAWSGSSGTPAGCEQAVWTQVHSALAGTGYDDTKPWACSGMSDAEVDQITGRILGQAFAG